MPRQPSLPTMLVPALGTDDAKPRLTRGNNQTTSHPRTPRSPSRAQDHVHTVKEHSISFLTSPAPSYMPRCAASGLSLKQRGAAALPALTLHNGYVLRLLLIAVG